MCMAMAISSLFLTSVNFGFCQDCPHTNRHHRHGQTPSPARTDTNKRAFLSFLFFLVIHFYWKEETNDNEFRYGEQALSLSITKIDHQ
mmetsp:Transcript_30072/g.62871  ORF Transcript_30072/g.62871 Transcript_30072/m.62871 type:complete len:88 (-) Transcript_30072:376-639(-)